jgi:hypothetical protein
MSLKQQDFIARCKLFQRAVESQPWLSYILQEPVHLKAR